MFSWQITEYDKLYVTEDWGVPDSYCLMFGRGEEMFNGQHRFIVEADGMAFRTITEARRYGMDKYGVVAIRMVR